MWDLVISGSVGGIVVAVSAILFWLAKNFILQYINKYVEHEFTTRTETFKSELQAKHQEQEHFHELMLQTISQENKELKSRKISATDQLWKSTLSMKRFSIAVKFLGRLNFDEIKKRASDPKIQKFLNSFPQCSFAELLKEAENTKENPAESARPWVTHKAWSLYLAYTMIIYYAISHFESAKLGGSLDSMFDEEKLLEVIKNALPEMEISQILPSILGQLHDLIELTLLIELKNTIESKEDATAIARAKTIFEITADIKNSIKLKDIN